MADDERIDEALERYPGVRLMRQSLERRRAQIAARSGEYVCPNGHPFPGAQTVRCERCEAGVVCVPLAQVRCARDEIEHLRHAMQDADKVADDPTTARAILRAALAAYGESE